MEYLKVTSPAFSNNRSIPVKYTADGEDINPELLIEGIPAEAKTLALVVDDPDAPAGNWVHWVVFNIPVQAANAKITENSVPGTEGINDFKKTSWGGPAPPSGTHRYFFRVYALDILLDLGEGALRNDVEKAMNGHILTQGELTGKYSRRTL